MTGPTSSPSEPEFGRLVRCQEVAARRPDRETPLALGLDVPRAAARADRVTALRGDLNHVVTGTLLLAEIHRDRAAADTRGDEHEYESAVKRMQEAVKGMLGRLDDRERRIIVSRFGLGGADERTLEQLGKELGIKYT